MNLPYVTIVATALTFGSMVHAETTEITDIAGRTVEVDLPVERVILGEGRQTYVVAALDRDDPFGRIVGWRDDLMKADPASYRAYEALAPEIADIPTFGGMKDGTFDVEQAIALKPDVILMNIEAQLATEEAGLVETLDELGIPVVYIDFRERPMENTEASLRLMGRMFGREDVAAEIIDFRADALDAVTSRLAGNEHDTPLVFVERAAGYSDDCCMSFGDENFGAMVELAGGKNLAADLIPGTFGTVNPEQIIAADPQVYVATGAEWDAYVPGGAWIGMGPGNDMEAARASLRALMDRPAFTGVAAVENGRVHAIWHQFYNSPYQFAAVQQIAQWVHPDLFADLDPEATLAEFYDRFLPVPFEPGFFVSADGFDPS